MRNDIIGKWKLTGGVWGNFLFTTVSTGPKGNARYLLGTDMYERGVIEIYATEKGCIYHNGPDDYDAQNHKGNTDGSQLS